MDQVETTNDNWKTKFLIMGTAVGAVVGLGTAYLLTRTAEESHNGPPKISTGDVLKASFNIVGIMRGIAALGGR